MRIPRSEPLLERADADEMMAGCILWLRALPLLVMSFEVALNKQSSLRVEPNRAHQRSDRRWAAPSSACVPRWAARVGGITRRVWGWCWFGEESVDAGLEVDDRAQHAAFEPPSFKETEMSRLDKRECPAFTFAIKIVLGRRPFYSAHAIAGAPLWPWNA